MPYEPPVTLSKPKRRVRMKDIADTLNISLSTVSRALNADTNGRISPEVVAEVQATAKRLGYISDETAAGLRRQRTFTVGMVVPDILNPVFPPIIKGAQNYLAKLGYVMFIVYSDNNQNVATSEIQKLIGRRVDGLILASAFVDDHSVDYCREQGTPFVLVSRTTKNSSHIAQVLEDSAEGMAQSIEHVYQLGHRKLVHLAGPANIFQGLERRNTFERYCAERGIDAEVIQLEAFSTQAGEAGAQRFLAQGLDSTALLAGNDLIAVGAIKVLREAGVRVPEDISVIGYNDMPLADMLNPPLTTIAIPHAHLGEKAAKLLVEAIDSPEGPKQKVWLTPSLVVRQSTAVVAK